MLIKDLEMLTKEMCHLKSAAGLIAGLFFHSSLYYSLHLALLSLSTFAVLLVFLTVACELLHLNLI